ncbi:MAG: tRNA (uridine(34)/cytosine(34)/5-carboxymethylaminomethyluridine(34)-2'-O)-methyltransferase TrmL [Chlamydiae bacterium CG10_big_fil_rev_8_21_14_0_10_35_9]|nr:MAG: tRNA (uridine(34)/cytosine(34)/5-carboxymethylaminomethyluridine(34)-2'-O)-methyltransferase TrmL [Chlamydiae bacterium CG10_big_fil_rev_8_21_14_0_10_35_9]
MKVILYQPEIPSNTGNVIRTCFITGVSLALVKPLGFSISDKQMKRAGLDYYKNSEIELIDSLPDYLDKHSNPFYFFSSKATKNYTEVSYPANSFLIFGSETSGLPKEYFERWPDNFVTLPMKRPRCLNLSNTVAIATYEALRQQNFNFIS